MKKNRGNSLKNRLLVLACKRVLIFSLEKQMNKINYIIPIDTVQGLSRIQKEDENAPGW